MTVSRAHLADYSRRVRPLIRLGEVKPTQSAPPWDLAASATNVERYAVTAEDASTSLSSWVDATQPPILFEHEERDRASGDPRLEHGYVTGVLRLSEDEARAKGIESQSGDWLYAELACTPDLIELIDAGRVRGVSPTLELGYVDDEGQEWPLVLRELSFVAEPRLRTQPRGAELDAASLRDPGGRMARKMSKAARAKVLRHASACVLKDQGGRLLGRGVASLADIEEMEPSDVVVVTTEEGDPIATATVAEIVEVAEELEAAVVEEPLGDEPPEEMADTETRLAAVEAALARIEEMLGGASMSDKPRKRGEVDELRQKIALLETRETVRVELADREIPQGGEDRLVRLRMADHDAYLFAAGLLPRRKVAAARIGLGDAVAAKGQTEEQRAKSIAAAEGIKFSDALLRVRREGVQ